MIKKNIITKLTAGFMFIVIISTLIIGIIAINIFKNNIFKIKEKNITSHGKELEKILEPYIESEKKPKEYMDILKLINNVDNTKTWIVNINGRITTVNDNEEIVIQQNNEIKNTYSDVIQAALHGNIKKIQEYNSYYNQEMMTISIPITDNNKILGAILVHSSIKDLSSTMDKFFLYLIAALLGEVILAGIMGFYFSKNIVKPIKVINNAALEMTGGNYHVRTSIRQQDEIGELSGSFDLLASRLQYNIEQLFLEKNKLADIIISMKEGLIAVDKEYRIININSSAVELLNIRNYETHKLNLEDLGIKDIVKNTFNSNKKENIIKVLGDKTLNLSISPVISKSMEYTGVVILIQDISEQENLEKMRKDFIANVSHEFRTPLTVIRGNLEALNDNVIPQEEKPQNYAVLLRETKRLESLVKDLLDLSTLESGKVILNFEKVDIKNLLHDVVRVLMPIIREKNINIELSAQDNLPAIWSDYDKLKQLLIIFLDNAVKFSNENSIVQMRVNSKQHISVSIRDFGIGIPKEAISHIGERFYKADKSRKYSNMGTGLGISIAKHLAQLLNCKFKILSDINKGTEVLITFLELEDEDSPNF